MNKLPVQLPLPQGAVVRGTLSESATQEKQTGQSQDKLNDKSHGMLQLGNLKIPVEIPKGANPGRVWVQMQKTAMPYQMKLLTPEQAQKYFEQKLMDLFKPQMQQGEQAQQQKHNTPQQLQQHAQVPQPLNQPDQPFQLLPTSEGWQMWSKDDEHLKGMLQAEQDGDSYQIQGRLDLENLGRVQFSLLGARGVQPRVDLRVMAAMRSVMGQEFQQWLAVHDCEGRCLSATEGRSGYGQSGYVR